MKLAYLIAAAFAIAATLMGAVNAYNNAMAINHGRFVLNDLTMLVSGLAIAAAMIFLVLPIVWKHSKSGAVVAFIAATLCTITSTHYTVTRVGGLTDTNASTAISHNAKLQRAIDKVDVLAKDKRAECATGYGRKCRGLMKDLKAAETALAGIGARMVVDPAAERFSAAVGGAITPEQYRTALPLITGMAPDLVIGVLFMIAGVFLQLTMKPAPVTVTAEVVRVEPAHPVIAALRDHGATSNRELARRLGWQESRTSKAVARLKADGLVTSEQTGRNKVISVV